MGQPVIPWIGGKRRLLQQLLPLLPDHECYVEPFCGAAAVLFAKERAKVEVINDINSELVRLYRVLQHHLEEFVRQFKWALASREMFTWAQQTPPPTLTDIQRAARFYYLQKLAFGGRVAGQTFGTATTAPARLNLLRVEEELSEAHLRLNGVFVEHLPWAECVQRYDRPHTLFYMDPPYWGTEGYGVEFGFENYEQMAALLGSMKGRAVVSVNDIPAMRKVFAGLPSKSVSLAYTVGRSKASRKPASELIVWNQPRRRA